MPPCPRCGVATAPGPACGACGAPLPQEATAAPDLVAVRTVGALMLAVGIFVAVSGVLLLGTMSWLVSGDPTAFFFPLGVATAGGIGIAAGSGLLATQRWAWGLAVGLAAFGLIYAVTGLARGYSSGLIGLAVWGGLGYGLFREDVRTPLGQ